MSDEEFRLPKVTVFDHTVDGYLQLNAFYNYVVKREQEIQGWQEKAEQWDKWLESDAILTEAVDISDKLEAVKNLLVDVCEDYGTENCREGVCDCDPNGWEGCLTRKILEILGVEC